MGEKENRQRPLWERINSINRFSLQANCEIKSFGSVPLYTSYLDAQKLTTTELDSIKDSIHKVEEYLHSKKLPETVTGIRIVLLRKIDELQTDTGMDSGQISTLLTMFINKQNMLKYRLSLKK